MTRDYHVVPRWEWRAVVREWSDRASIIVWTQSEGIDAWRGFAQNNQTELVIHRPNGQIREAWSYGNDPESSKG